MTVTIEDAATHRPDTADPRWQESFYLGWYDSLRRIGGAHHVSISPNRGVAHVWSWLSVDGVTVGRSQDHGLPCPDAAVLDLRVGTLALCTASLTNMRLSASFDRASVTLDYAAVCEPVEFSMDGDAVSLGGHHYETTGRVVGTVTVDGTAVQVDAGAWQDHSWGLRELGSLLSSRFFFAVFGDSMAMSAHLLVSRTGATKSYGWTFDHGRIARIERYLVPATVAQDGISPIACDIRVNTFGGGGFRIGGEVDATVLMGGADWTEGDWFGMDGLTRFECGGRLGEGILEISELRSLTPDHRSSLRLGSP